MDEARYHLIANFRIILAIGGARQCDGDQLRPDQKAKSKLPTGSDPASVDLETTQSGSGHRAEKMKSFALNNPPDQDRLVSIAPAELSQPSTMKAK